MGPNDYPGRADRMGSMSFDIITRIENASLNGFGLMGVMLACLFVGALAVSLAYELDAKALWAAVRRNKPAETANDEGGAGAKK